MTLFFPSEALDAFFNKSECFSCFNYMLKSLGLQVISVTESLQVGNM